MRSKTFSLHQALLIGLVLMLALIMAGCGSAGAGATKAGPISSPGALSASPTSIDFGSVNVGSTKDLPLTLSNPGGAAVNVSQIHVTGTAFSDPAMVLPVSIPAGQNVQVTIHFAPQSGGTLNGSVAVTSDAPTAIPDVTLTGIGSPQQPQATVTPVSVNFANVTLNASATQNLTIQNTGGSPLSVTAINITGAGFSVTGFSLPLSIAASQSSVGQIKFAPTTAGTVNGTITLVSNSLNPPATVNLAGTGVASVANIGLSPTTFAFGNVTTGTSSSKNITISNTGTANLVVTQVTPAGAGFSISGLTLPLTVTPGQSKIGQIVFSPTALGAVTGSLAITSNSASATPSVTLSGTGTAPATFLLGVSPTTLSFPATLVGSTASLPVTLSNTGNSSVTVTAGNVTGDFSLSGITFPKTIAAGGTAAVTVQFAPQLSGPSNGSVSFVSNATNSPATVTMTGSGTAPQPHSVDLSWDASTSVVNGYYVYRGSQTGGPYSRINSTPQVGTGFTDSTVASGNTYFYVVTAVDSNSVESLNSNEVQTAVPTP